MCCILCKRSFSLDPRKIVGQFFINHTYPEQILNIFDSSEIHIYAIPYYSTSLVWHIVFS